LAHEFIESARAQAFGQRGLLLLLSEELTHALSCIVEELDVSINPHERIEALPGLEVSLILLRSPL
jgi:hypothetical protein